MSDLYEDLKDGVMLLALLEVLSGQKLVSFPSHSFSIWTLRKTSCAPDLFDIFGLIEGNGKEKNRTDFCLLVALDKLH